MPSPGGLVLLTGKVGVFSGPLALESSVLILVGFWCSSQFSFVRNKCDTVHNPLSETPGTWWVGSKLQKFSDFRNVWFIYSFWDNAHLSNIIISALKGMNIHTEWDKLRPYHINSDQILLSNEFRLNWIFLPNELWKHFWLLELFGFWIVNKRLLDCVLISNCDFCVYFFSWFLACRAEESRGRYTKKLIKASGFFCDLITYFVFTMSNSCA